MENSEEKKLTENPISVGDVTGNVVISQNQMGGVTAHTVNVTQEKQLTQNDIIAILNFIEGIKKKHNFNPTTFSISMVNNSNGNTAASQIEYVLKQLGYTMNGTSYGFMMRYPAVKGIILDKAKNNDSLEILIGQI